MGRRITFSLQSVIPALRQDQDRLRRESMCGKKLKPKTLDACVRRHDGKAIPMPNRIDPRYTFTFTSEANPRYSRTVYWEDIYAFTYSDRTILVATRVVPHSSAQYALYETLKSCQQAPILNKILPEASGASTRRVQEGCAVSDIAQSVTDLVAGHMSSVPAAVVAAAERKYEAVVSEAMVRSRIEQGLDVFADPDGVQLGASGPFGCASLSGGC